MIVRGCARGVRNGRVAIECKEVAVLLKAVALNMHHEIFSPPRNF